MRRTLLTLVAITALFAPALTKAAGLFGKCDHCGHQCDQRVLVECTVMVPMKVMETRMKSCLVETTEERDETYTVFHCEPVKKEIKKECCYLEDEVKTKTITESNCKIMDVPVSVAKNVKVPLIECVEECVQREVCTECGPVCVEEMVMVEKARMVDDVRVEQRCDPQLIFDVTKRDIFYCVKTPKKQTIECAVEETVKLVGVEKTRKVCVTVPKFVKQPVEVEVTKMVPKKIMCCVECSKHRHH